MSPLKNTLISGLSTAILGFILLPFLFLAEENIGLDILFRLRGQRTPPSEVVIVTVDKESADKLHLSPEPYKWPRSLHARLTRTLAAKGAKAIVFDLIFKEPGPREDDDLFAHAIRDAGNVVLCEQLAKDVLCMNDQNGAKKAALSIETVVPLIPEIAQSAVVAAPFPLPKVPRKISQCWIFKPGAGGVPTLPAVSLQVFARNVFHDFLKIIQRTAPRYTAERSLCEKGAVSDNGLQSSMMAVKDIFTQIPDMGKNALCHLETDTAFSQDREKRYILESLVLMYQENNNRFLDFYGPPGTINTIPFHELILNEKNHQHHALDGKAVFIGLSERLRPEEKDGFYTSFSQQSGVDISGVEIAATAFANLLEKRQVRPLSMAAHLAVIFLGGLLLGIMCRVLPTLFAAPGVVGIGAIYLLGAQYAFKTNGLWLPIVVPLMFQAPFAFFGTVLWKHVETHQERENVKKALGYYVPGKIVNQMAKQMKDIRSNKQSFHGTCLCTDAERYTALSETMAPEKLGDLMNRYFQTIFEPIKAHQGMVSEVVGDAMIAVWPRSSPDTHHRVQACLAAMDLVAAVNRFNHILDRRQLPTRLGLHSGSMMIGNIGAMDRYEYNPIGDMVNTASRIEGLNKYLGTRILASAEVIKDLEDFLFRDMGTFLLAGKSRPILVYELLGRKGDVAPWQEDLCIRFKAALDAYMNKDWNRAGRLFSDILKLNRNDGPSRFYRDRCDAMRQNSENKQDGVIDMNQK